MPAVESGDKTCTIRATRKIPIKVRDPLYLYTGARTRACRPLQPWNGAAEFCREEWSIFIERIDLGVCVTLTVDDLALTFSDAARMERLARFDGFAGAEDFTSYFVPKARSSFEGQLIRWNHPTAGRRFIPLFDAIRV